MILTKIFFFNHNRQQELVEKWPLSNVSNEGVHLYHLSGGQFGDRSQKLYKFNPRREFRDVDTALHKRLAIKALSVMLKNGTNLNIHQEGIV